jgi:hypothetical protein
VDSFDNSHGSVAGHSAQHEERRFEQAVIAVILDVLADGERVDQAARRHLGDHAVFSQPDHAYADLVICAADTADFLRALAADGQVGVDELARSMRQAWERDQSSPAPDVAGPRTRVQTCLANLRRAIAAG